MLEYYCKLRVIINKLNQRFMNNLNQSDDQADNMPTPIEHFYARIKGMPQLLDQALAINHTLSFHFKQIQADAFHIVNHLDDEKEDFLKKFDIWLLPIAKEVWENLFHEAEELKSHLANGLENPEALGEMNWIDHAKAWAALCSHWQDKNELVQKVLLIASERATQLVDKDIKLVQDYQDQLIAQRTQETGEVLELEERLSHVTEDSLKQLHNLKEPPDLTSIKHVSDWMANLYTKRATYFDHLLMKIDAYVKDMIHIEDVHDPMHFTEIEGEIKFMDYELNQINDLIPNLNKKNKEEVIFIEDRLRGIGEHLEQFDQKTLPGPLRQKFESIQSRIRATEEKLR